MRETLEKRHGVLVVRGLLTVCLEWLEGKGLLYCVYFSSFPKGFTDLGSLSTSAELDCLNPVSRIALLKNSREVLISVSKAKSLS